jgi:cell division protein FtsQ
MQEFESDISKKNYVKYFAFFLILISLIIIIYDYGYLGKTKNLSGISKLIINGHDKLKKEEIAKILNITEDFSIERANLKDLEQKLSSHPRIKKASISRRAKDQLLISIEEHKAKFILNTNDNLYELNEDLKMISKNDVRDESLPILSGEFSLENRNQKKLKDFSISINEMFESYPKLKDRISEIHLNDEGEITIFTNSPKNFKIFIGPKLENLQARKIYASLAFFENRSLNIKLLDLRGEDAVYQ